MAEKRLIEDTWFESSDKDRWYYEGGSISGFDLSLLEMIVGMNGSVLTHRDIFNYRADTGRFDVRNMDIDNLREDKLRQANYDIIHRIRQLPAAIAANIRTLRKVGYCYDLDPVEIYGYSWDELRGNVPLFPVFSTHNEHYVGDNTMHIHGAYTSIGYNGNHGSIVDALVRLGFSQYRRVPGKKGALTTLIYEHDKPDIVASCMVITHPDTEIRDIRPLAGHHRQEGDGKVWADFMILSPGLATPHRLIVGLSQLLDSPSVGIFSLSTYNHKKDFVRSFAPALCSYFDDLVLSA